MIQKISAIALTCAYVTMMSGCTNEPCNGAASLCDKSLSDLVFPTTHNANAALEYGYSYANANQTYGIKQQLDDGIRAMMLDVTYDNGETVLCHGPCNLGKTPHAEALAWFADWLADNPREVLIFLYQDSIEISDLEQDYMNAGLQDITIALDLNAPLPTLQELIDQNDRILVTTERATPPPDWVHHLWTVAWDTPYSFDTVADFRCELNRGDDTNPLFLMNHWLSGPYGVPSQDEAQIANQYEVLMTRAQECRERAGQQPNFIAVDWYREGDLFRVVSELNDIPF